MFTTQSNKKDEVVQKFCLDEKKMNEAAGHQMVFSFIVEFCCVCFSGREQSQRGSLKPQNTSKQQKKNTFGKV